ncbi:hypothetical protein [Bacillus sp. FJAT-26390]|uniref:phage tail fiber protein n=1 Tax=Bacillus sp. FJAT-26390 TaxID=1743142 RepID=UPI000807E4CD|nr:hypothetical protein [Bacillus sp. FJAT-26390]OBZ13345.1 hypothetical protein A7975_10850 [Bacillus sp. FJAT-26390]
MSGSLSPQSKNNMLDAELAGTLYVGLFTDAAGLLSNQTPTTEATAGNCPGYTRQAVTHAAAANGLKETNSAVAFTATGNWATVRYAGVFTAVTGGALKYWADLRAAGVLAPKTPTNGEQVTIAAGELEATLISPAT